MDLNPALEPISGRTDPTNHHCLTISPFYKETIRGKETMQTEHNKLGGLIVRNARMGDLKILTSVLRDSNEAALGRRPDIFRRISHPIPPVQYALSILAREILDRLSPNGFGRHPIALKIAEIDENFAGMIYVERRIPSRLSFSAFHAIAYVEELFVMPEYRRQGIGEALESAAIQWARDQNIPYIEGKIDVNNTASQNLVSKTGRKQTHVIMGMRL